jgi:hypothetical protein
VSALGDAFAALKNVILMQDKLERMQRQIDSSAGDLRGLRDYAVEIDKRVARIEGVMEGVARASTAPRRPRLQKK